MVHAALLLLMLEAVHTDLVFTISLKRSTQNLQLSTSSPAETRTCYRARAFGKTKLAKRRPAGASGSPCLMIRRGARALGING
jgi:hypothetical protein